MFPTWVSTVLGDMYSWLAMAWLERPSAIRASTASSRSVRVSSGLSRRGLATSRETTCGSITDSPAATLRIASVNCADVSDPLLEHVADAAGIVGQQLEQVLGLDMLRHDQDRGARPPTADL